jgi:hypothetical protein
MFIDEREGAAVKAALTKSSEGFVTVRGVTIKKTSISKLEPGGVDPRTDLFHQPTAGELPTGKVCRAEKSLAKELMRIATVAKDFNLLRDPKWRAAETKKLKANGQIWCDAKAGTCACVDPVPAIA